MPVPNIFEEGQPVDADKVNANFADVLTKITEEVASATGSGSTLSGRIDDVAAIAQAAQNKANSSVQLKGDQKVENKKTFSGTLEVTGTIKVPNTKTAGTAIALKGADITSSGYGGLSLGTDTKINIGSVTISGKGHKDFTFKYPFTSKTSYKAVTCYIDTEDVNWTAACTQVSGSTLRVYANSRTVNIIAIGK